MKLIHWIDKCGLPIRKCGFWQPLSSGHIIRCMHIANFAIKRSVLCLSYNLSDFDEIWYTDANCNSENSHVTKKSKFHKSKTADGRHLENCFSAISHRHSVRFMRNLEEWSRMNRTETQVTWPKLQISKVSDDRWSPFWKWLYHYISHYLDRCSFELDDIWCANANFDLDNGHLKQNKNQNFTNQDCGRTPYWNSCSAISQRHIFRLARSSKDQAESLTDTGHVTKTADFENSRWWMAAISKMVMSVYLSRNSFDFDEIWYSDANFDSDSGHVTQNHNFANTRRQIDTILKIVFGCISAPFVRLTQNMEDGAVSHLTSLFHLWLYCVSSL